MSVVTLNIRPLSMISLRKSCWLLLLQVAAQVRSLEHLLPGLCGRATLRNTDLSLAAVPSVKVVTEKVGYVAEDGGISGL